MPFTQLYPFMYCPQDLARTEGQMLYFILCESLSCYEMSGVKDREVYKHFKCNSGFVTLCDYWHEPAHTL